MKPIIGCLMIYDLFYVSNTVVDNARWEAFKKRFPTAQKIDNVSSFEELKRKSFTKMFWVVWDEFIIKDDFDFSYRATQYDDQYIHVFKNKQHFDGVCLFPKNANIASREFNNRFYINKKEVDIDASSPIEKCYDVVFISYQEPNADENYKKLLEKFPDAKRIHGVKGIHQAHIAAATQCNSEMFYVVDGDAIIEKDFDFNYRVAAYDRNIVHVWRSKNPVNDLVYGYGGVKLLPKLATQNMRVDSTDMTTSISSRITVVDQVSNITEFNTDPFNTWKSAFRECVKLSSKIIKGQINSETEHRLHIWCTKGADRPFGEYAIRGAIEGKQFGEDNKHNPANLSKINDFEWLIGQYGI